MQDAGGGGVSGGKIFFYALGSIIYWQLLLYLGGGLLFASVCHYPDTPECETNLALPIAVFLAGIGLYGLVTWLFVRRLRASTKVKD
jgi:hypothetical protein